MECIFCLNENAYFDGVNYVCPDCGREWPCDEIADDDDDNNKLRCPECGSHLVYPDSSGINDYACDACGCRWDGDDDDYDEDYDHPVLRNRCYHRQCDPRPIGDPVRGGAGPGGAA